MKLLGGYFETLASFHMRPWTGGHSRSLAKGSSEFSLCEAIFVVPTTGTSLVATFNMTTVTSDGACARTSFKKRLCVRDPDISNLASMMMTSLNHRHSGVHLFDAWTRVAHD